MSVIDKRLFERHITRTSRLRNSAHMSHLEHQKYNLYKAEQKNAEREEFQFDAFEPASDNAEYGSSIHNLQFDSDDDSAARTGGNMFQAARSSSPAVNAAFSTASPAEPVKPPRIGSPAAILQSEIDTYIRTEGRVLLRRVPLDREIDAVRHLRSFLFQYGPTLNFCYDNWCMVTMVLESDDKTSTGQQGQTKKRRNDVKAYRAIYAEKVLTDVPLNAREKNTQDKAVTSTDNGLIRKASIPVVVEFPSDFRPTLLLDVLLELPAASILRDRA